MLNFSRPFPQASSDTAMMDDSAPKSSGFAAAVSHYGLLYGRARQQATRADRIVTIPPDGTAMAWGNFEVFSMFRNFEHDRVQDGGNRRAGRAIASISV
jgi:hypothetical protein